MSRAEQAPHGSCCTHSRNHSRGVRPNGWHRFPIFIHILSSDGANRGCRRHHYAVSDSERAGAGRRCRTRRRSRCSGCSGCVARVRLCGAAGCTGHCQHVDGATGGGGSTCRLGLFVPVTGAQSCRSSIQSARPRAACVWYYHMRVGARVPVVGLSLWLSWAVASALSALA